MNDHRTQIREINESAGPCFRPTCRDEDGGAGKMVYRSKHGVLLTLSREDRDPQLGEVISALEATRLVARKARKNGLDSHQFAVFLQARVKADRLAREAEAAKATCNHLLN